MPYSRRKALGAISTPFIAAIAGCSSDGGANESGNGNTTGTTTESLSADDIEFPDGYGKDSVDIEAAKQSHENALSNRSYTLKGEIESFDYGSSKATVKVEPSDSEVYIERRRRSEDYDTDIDTSQTRFRYITDQEYIKTIEDGETRYHVSDSSDFESRRHNVHWEMLVMFDFSLNRIRRDGGTPKIQFVAEELTDEAKEQLNKDFGEPRTATLEINENGLVQQYAAQVGEVGKDEMFFLVSTEITNVGQTSVSKPDWISEAKSAE